MPKLYIFIGLLVCVGLNSFAQELHPNDLEFRRQAVKRIIFDSSQNIPLSELKPGNIVGIDVMHPAVGSQANNLQLNIEKGLLKITAQEAGTSARWVGAFNPFATYDVAIDNIIAFDVLTMALCGQPAYGGKARNCCFFKYFLDKYLR